MIRILVLLVPLIFVYLAFNWFKKASPEQRRASFKKMALPVAILVFLILAATGKLNVLLAIAGVLIAFLVRSIPVILHYAPQVYRLWLLYVAGNRQDHRSQGSGQRRNGGKMTKAEALDVLGLKPGATEEDIIQAHRKLIAKLHPDRGGSDYLAAQINLAKKTLLHS